MIKANVLRRMTSDDSDSHHAGNKENIDTNKAAVVIQSRKFIITFFINDSLGIEIFA